jgi:SAM-dependent methyltransferase
MVQIRAAVLLLLPCLWLAASHAQDLGTPGFNEEFSKQESIYRSDGDQTIEGYTVDRALEVYADGLPSEFDRALAKLGPTDRWLDIGAGKGHAILDYYTRSYDLTPEGRKRRGAKAQAVAISIEDRRTPLWQRIAARLEPDQIRYLSGKRFRDYSSDELGEFDVITDVMGGFSYTDNVSVFMEKVLGLLELNGSFFTVLQDVHWEDGKNRPFYVGSPFLTEITKPDGSELKVCTWLKRIACVEVTCESKPSWEPPTEAFHVRKVCNDVRVPALSLTHYKAGTPPERRFQDRNQTN